MRKSIFRVCLLTLIIGLLALSAGAVEVTPVYEGRTCHHYIPKGETYREQIIFDRDDHQSSNLLFGTRSMLYKVALTGEETQEELNALGRELLRSGKKYVQFGLGYSSAFGEYAFDTERLQPGTYLAVAYCYSYQGDYLNPYNVTEYFDDSFSVALHLVPEDIPLERVDVYLCDENGNNRNLLDPATRLKITEGQELYIVAEVYPEDATWHIDMVMDHNDRFDVPSFIWGEEIRPGQVTRLLGYTGCGTGMLQILARPNYQSEETMVYDFAAAYADCVWNGRSYDVVKANTCTEEGLQLKRCRNYYCAGCPTVIEEEITPVKGHRFIGDPFITRKPTATKPGEGVIRCDRCLLPDAKVEVPPIFTDTSPEHYYSDAVDLCYGLGIVNGMTDTTFGPDLSITRGQMVTLLYRMGMDYIPQQECPFTDVPADAWYAAAVQWAYENGITTGISQTEFAPDKPVTREQMATFLHRYAQYRNLDDGRRAELEDFADQGAVSGYALESFRWAVAQGLINGMTPDTLAPAEGARRAQFVTILYRMIVAYPESF